MAATVVSCAEPVQLSISVHRSELLGDYANPPFWEWNVGAGAGVAVLEASFDGGPYRPLHPSNDAGVRPPRSAKIINLSLTEAVPGPVDEVLEDALRRVTEAGAIVAATAAARSPTRPVFADFPGSHKSGTFGLHARTRWATLAPWPVRKHRQPRGTK